MEVPNKYLLGIHWGNQFDPAIFFIVIGDDS